jgi:hypothetical protein
MPEGPAVREIGDLRMRLGGRLARVERPAARSRKKKSSPSKAGCAAADWKPLARWRAERVTAQQSIAPAMVG